MSRRRGELHFLYVLRFRIALIVIYGMLALSPLAAQDNESGEISARLIPSYYIPLSSDLFINSMGAGVSFDYKFENNLGLSLNGEYISLTAKGNSPYTLAEAGLGLNYTIPLGERFSIKPEITAGYYGLSKDSQSISGISAAGRMSLNFKINPQLSINAFGGYKYWAFLPDPLMQAAEAGIALEFNLSETVNTTGKVEVEAVKTNQIFPVFYSWYDSNEFAEIKITNNEKNSIQNVKIYFYLEQYMNQPTLCDVSAHMSKGESATVSIKAFFNETMLELTEGTQAEAKIIVSYETLGTEKESTSPLTLFVNHRNAMSWSDDRRAAAFVSSKDPASLWFSKVVSAVVSDRFRSGVNSNIQYAMGVFETLRLYGINYVVDPSSVYADFASSTESIDFLQYPYQTLTYRGGDCDDISILICSLLEGVGIETGFITVPGHIYMAFSLGMSEEEAKESFHAPDKLIFIDGKAWVPLEGTLVKEGFSKAWAVGSKQWNDNEARGEAAFFPIHNAWELYTPVSIPGAASRFSLPEDKAISMAFDSGLEKYVRREIKPQIKELETELAKNDSPEIRNKLGILYGKYGMFSDARRELTASAGKGYNHAWTNLGNIAFMEGEYNEALNWYKKTLSVNPKNALALLGSARCYYELEEFGTSDAYYSLVGRFDPELSSQYTYLSSFFETKGRAWSLADRLETTSWSKEKPVDDKKLQADVPEDKPLALKPEIPEQNPPLIPETPELSDETVESDTKQVETPANNENQQPEPPQPDSITTEVTAAPTAPQKQDEDEAASEDKTDSDPPDPEATKPEPTSAVIAEQPDQPEPEAITPDPEPAAIAEQPEPETITPAQEPEAIAEQPVPEAITPDPEPAAIAEQPEPETITPAPEPEAIAEQPVPEAITPDPEPAAIAEQPAQPEPEAVTPTPEPEAIAEQPAQPEPETITPAPEPTAIAEQPAQPEPEAITPDPEPAAIAEQLAQPESEAITPAPKPEAIAEQPAQPEPEAITPTPEPEAVAEQPSQPESEAITPASEPEAIAEQPAQPEPETITPDPEPEAVAEQPAQPEPETITSAPETVAEQPEQPEPEAVTPAPETVAEQPAQPEPEAVKPDPEPAAIAELPTQTEPEAITPAPEPAAVAERPALSELEEETPAPEDNNEPVFHTGGLSDMLSMDFSDSKEDSNSDLDALLAMIEEDVKDVSVEDEITENNQLEVKPDAVTPAPKPAAVAEQPEQAEPEAVIPTSVPAAVAELPAQPDPEAVTPAPEPAAVAEQPTQTEPEAITPAPEPTAIAELPAQPDPEAVKPDPEPAVVAEQPAQPEPEAITPAPEPAAVAEQPTQTEPEAITPAPEPAAVAEQPTQTEPEAITPAPEPTAIAELPDQPEPEAVKPDPEPAAIAEQPAPTEPKTITPATEPAAVAEQPTQTEPKTITPAPEPAAIAEQPVQPEPEAVIPAQETAAVAEQPTQTEPEAITPAPEPTAIAEQPAQTEPVAIVPETADDSKNTENKNNQLPFWLAIGAGLAGLGTGISIGIKRLLKHIQGKGK